MKILWLTNVPSPYRTDFFNELGLYCKLTVLFEKETSTERDKSWENNNFYNFFGIFLKGRASDVDKAISFSVIPYLKSKRYDYIIVSNAATPTGMIAIEYMKMYNIPYLLEGDGGFKKDGKGIKERYKKHLLKGATGYLSTSKSHDEYYRMYGAEESVMYRYPFTSVKENEIINELPSQDKKSQMKEELGLQHEYLVLSIGQFIKRKGFDVLIKASRLLGDDTLVCIIGGKETKEYGAILKEYNITNVIFKEFQVKEELEKYFLAADVFVLPTREDIWGLVINEAMAYGLPIITTNKCVAGLELINDYENGFLISIDNETILSDRMMEIIHNKELRRNMGENNLIKIRNYTIEEMAKRHMEVLKELKKKEN